jgi:ATP adenylyltransferase
MPDERSTVFQQLKTFLTNQMRMSHLYQPLMLKTLIEKGGAASLRDIASTFLAHDESQIEYYMEITKRMPGPVLTRHQLVKREGTGYGLVPDVQQLPPEERDELLRLCDEAVENYTGRRGRKLYDHRRIALGDISGTARYEVLRRAGFRCDLCGISAEERAIEHTQPRALKHMLMWIGQAKVGPVRCSRHLSHLHLRRLPRPQDGRVPARRAHRPWLLDR